jgi:hypothetical protein
MSSVRSGAPGATRVCPHCKATVLESMAVCPGCRHHLRFNTGSVQQVPDDAYCALNVEGTITHKLTNESCEYCVVLDIRNDRGEQIVRHVVGVGLLQPGERRRVNVSVDLVPVRAQVAVQKPPAQVNAPPAPAVRPTLQPPGIKAPAVAAVAPAKPAGTNVSPPASPPAPKSIPEAAQLAKSLLQPPPAIKPPGSSTSTTQRNRIFWNLNRNLSVLPCISNTLAV